MTTHRVTMTTTAHGDDEAHRTGCADLKRGHRADRTHDLGEFGSRLQVADSWYSDQIEENDDATAEQYVGSIHFAPCLDKLPATLAMPVLDESGNRPRCTACLDHPGWSSLTGRREPADVCRACFGSGVAQPAEVGR